MEKKGNRICVECQIPTTKYRCPKCRDYYCSMTCWNKHKESCPVLSEKTISSVVETIAVVADDKSENKGEIDIQHEIIHKNSATSESSALLSEEAKEKLSKSSYMKSILRSKRLRDQISSILTSDDRISSLRKNRDCNPDFQEFVNRMLQELR